MTMLFAVASAAAAADSPLLEAVKNQDQQKAGTLLTQHADVNVRSNDGSTALLWTAHWGDVKTTDLLLRAGADPNAANDFGMTPLSQACVNGSGALVELLLKAGANPNTPIATGETPLMTCSKTGGTDAVRTLIAHDAAINAKEPVQSQTALMWAAAERHPGVVKMLIDAKANLQARTKSGFTALHFAAREGDQESARLLLAAGVSVNILVQPDSAEKGKAGGPETAGPVASGAAAGNAAAGGAVAGPRGVGRNVASAGYTPLLVATVRGQVELALYLLAQGADPNVADAGFTPLHWAVATWENGSANPVYGFEDPMSGIPDRQAKLRLVKALLAHGADPNARMKKRPPMAGGYLDVDGATPFLLASSVDDVEMMRILQAGWSRSQTGHRHECDTDHGGDWPQPSGGGKRRHGSAGARGGQVSAGSRHGPEGHNHLR